MCLAGIFACSSDSGEKSKENQTSSDKPTLSVLVLTQAVFPEGLLATSISAGLRTALTQIQTTGVGLGEFAITIVEREVEPNISDADLKSLLEQSAIVFASVDLDLANRVAETSLQVPTVVFFANDGPLRTCKTAVIDEVQSNLWQLGLTDSQTVEPFLIHLAERFKDPKKPFRFSFFSTDALWPRIHTDYLIDNVEALGFKLVFEQYLDRRITDFYEPLRRSLRIQGNVLFITVTPSLLSTLVEQSRKMLVQRDFTLALLWMMPEEALSRFGDRADGVVTASRFVPAFSPEMSEEARAIWTEDVVKELSTATRTSTYIATNLLHRALQHRDYESRGKIDTERLTTVLSKVSFPTPMGRTWFSKENHVLTQPLFGVRIEGGKYTDQKFLGDVEHPQLTRCSHEYLLPIEVPQESESLYD